MQIPNELIDSMIKSCFTASEFKIVLIVIRKTYGWRKEKVRLSFSQLSFLTQVSMRHAKRAVKKLIKDNVILNEKRHNKNLLGINGKFNDWRLWKTQECPDEIVTRKVTGSSLEKCLS